MDDQKDLPLPQKDLPLPQKDLPLPEKELPPPHDMLLRAPTFWEKYPYLKWLLPLLIILLIAIPGGLYVLSNQVSEQESPDISTQKPTPTQSLFQDNIYISDTFGFRLEIPAGWQAVEDQHSVTFAPTSGDTEYSLSIFVEESDLTPQQYWAQRVKEGTRNPQTTPTTIAGIQGIRTENNSLDRYDITDIISNNGKLYTLQQNYTLESDYEIIKQKFPKAESEFKQILSTFRFLDQEHTIGAKSLKTYTNKQFGYSFNYPTLGSPNSERCVRESNGNYSVSFDLSLPLKIFEDNETTYLASNYYYKVDNEVATNDGISYANCDKVTNSISTIQSDRPYAIPIQSKIVTNDTELNTFITDIFGKYCTLGTKKQLEDGTYNVTIRDTGQDSGTGTINPDGRQTCPSVMYSLFYNTDTNVAVLMTMGHECLHGCREISESFTFLKPSIFPSSTGGIRTCTMEAKVCPDGSTVGRTGPNCEFAACPQ